MVDRDPTSITSGSIGAVLGTLIGEPLKGVLGAVGRPIYQCIKDGWELESIVKGVNKSDDLRLYLEVINSMEQFSLDSDEYIMLSTSKRDLDNLMIANIDGSRNSTWYTRWMKARMIQACKKKVHETDLTAVRALTERAKHHHGHYFVPTVDTSKPIVPRESYISDLRNLLANGPEWILLHGPGGVGKTHLVQYIFHMQKVRQLFGCVVYVEVGQGKDEKSVVVAIDSQLQMLPGYSPFYKVTNVGELTQSIQSLANRTSKKPMLIILDDVWDMILKRVNSPESSVRKLVISRKADMLDHLSRDRIAKLKVDPFSHEDGYTLFCLHAFGEEKAPMHINKYVESMVEECGGFPQALEVMGKYMAKDFETLHNPTKWGHVLEEIGRGEYKERDRVFKVLKISYDSLSHHEKMLFLSIAMHKRFDSDGVSVYYRWLALICYEHDDYRHRKFLSASKSLKDASLSEKDYYLSSMMEGLADYIIKEDRHPYFKLQNCHSFGVEAIYGSTGSMEGERVSDILSNDMPRLSVMHLDVEEPMHISLESCTNLKFLCLQSRFITICGLELLVHLRYLKIASDQRCWCSFQNILEALKRLHRLEVLEIRTRPLGGECDGEVPLDLRFLENMDRLNHFTIVTKFRSHPPRNLQYTRKMNHLQKFVINSWSTMSGGEPVEADPREFAWLPTNNQKLQTLDLSAVRFKEIPSEIDFPSLLCLRLNVATEYLPYGFEALHHLEELILDGGGTLLELPRMDKLPNLRRFELSGFLGEHLPESFGEAVPSLTYLTIANCQQLQELNFQSPLSLSDLYISRCNQLSQIEFKELDTVQHLRISNCNNLVEFHFQELKTVKELKISECNNLGVLYFQELKTVGGLKIFDCNNLVELHFQELKTVENLLISNCNNLVELHLQELKTVGYLHISDCNNFGVLYFQELKTVQRLWISNCNNLVELHFQELKTVQELWIFNCNNLVELHFQELKTVQHLRISNCNNLVELHFQELKTVQELWIFMCNNLVELHFQALECIKDYLDISKCNKLMQLDFIERVQLGSKTIISGCNNLQRLPPLSHISGHLWLKRCNRLVNCPDCHGELKKLVLEDLPSLTEIGYIPSLDILTLRNLPSLVEVPAVLNLTSRMFTDCGLARIKESLPNVEDLTVEGFTFKYLPPDITLLTGLKDLTIRDCPQLEALVEDHTQFSSLVNLERLGLYNLPKLTCLPDCVEVLGSVEIVWEP